MTDLSRDYSPGYDTFLESDVVKEGTRIKVRANTATGVAGLIDIDTNDEVVVNALHQRYLDEHEVDVWTLIYPGTTYTYWDLTDPNNPKTNAYKLVQAVQMYEYLNFGETSNILYNPEGDNLYAHNVAPSPDNRVPYSEYMSEDTPYRTPPESAWNSEVFYDTDGNRIDALGRKIPVFYVDTDMSPVFISDQIGTKEELQVFQLGLLVANREGRLPDTIPTEWFNSNGTMAKTVDQMTEEELQLIREVKDKLFSSNLLILPFAPHTLSGTRKMAGKLAGTYSQDLMSLEYMSKTEYQTTNTTPKTPYEWGGAYSTGRNVGFVVDQD